MDRAERENTEVRKCKPTRPGGKFQRPKVTAASYSSLVTYGQTTNSSATSYAIAAAADDGSIHFWDERKNPQFRKACVMMAHEPGRITALTWSHCGRYIASRSESEKNVKVWDVRMMKSTQKGDGIALSKIEGIEVYNEKSDVLWSPTDRYIAFSTSDKPTKGELSNKLYFANPQSGEIDKVYDLSDRTDSCINRIAWHDRINQIFLACNSGKVHTLYDPKISHHGAMLAASKKKKISSVSYKKKGPIGMIIAPIGLPIIKESDAYNITDVGIEIRYNRLLKQEGKLRPKEHIKKKLEDWAPRQAAGIGWDATASKLAMDLAKETKDVEIDDIRQSILRHSDAAVKNPKFVSQAYFQSQPVTFFQDDEATVKRKLKEAKKNEPIWKKLKKSKDSKDKINEKPFDCKN